MQHIPPSPWALTCFLLELQLQRLEVAERDLSTLEQGIQQKLESYATQLQLLDEIPGVDWTVAAVIIATARIMITTSNSSFHQEEHSSPRPLGNGFPQPLHSNVSPSRRKRSAAVWTNPQWGQVQVSFGRLYRFFRAITRIRRFAALS